MATGDITPPAPFDIVADAGEFQTGYAVASPYNNIYVTWEQTTDDSHPLTYEVSIDGVVARVAAEDPYPTITKRIEVPDGQHIVTVAAVDAAGNRQEATNSLDVVVDKVSPVFTSFPLLLLRRGPVTDAGYPMRYTWTGTDEGTGLALGRIGPNGSCCYSFDPNLPHYDFTVEPESSVAWRIWLLDGVGRFARTARDGYVSALPWSKTSHSGSWRKHSRATSMQGAEWLSRKKGDRFSFKVQGRSVAWVARTGPTMGKAAILVNGRLAGHVNLHTATTHVSRAVWTMKLPGHATKVTIVNRSGRERPTLSVQAVLRQR
jgi:hypothetical protein